MYEKWYFWLLLVVLVGSGIYFSTKHLADLLAAGCFVMAGLLMAAMLLPLLYQWQPIAAIAMVALLALMILLGIGVMIATAFRVAAAQKGKPKQQMDYILVLGAKVNGDVPSNNLQCRIDAACDYLTAHPQTVAVLSGGQGSDETRSEAQCMFRELTKRGIAEDRLWLEEKSTSTWENIVFSVRLIEGKTGIRPGSIGLVTSEFHLYRAGLFAAKSGIEILGIPGKTAKKAEYIYYFLREIAGVWHYYLLGGKYHD